LKLFDEVWFVEGGRLVFVGSDADLRVHSRYREFLELSSH